MFIDIYEVQLGDTFEGIAKKDVSLESRSLEIATMNGLKHNTSLVPGQVLKVVRKGVYKPKKHLFLESDNISRKSRIRR